MKLTDALLGEHGACYALFDHVEAALPRLETLTEVRRVAELVGGALLSHSNLEDELLFPALEARIGSGGPLVVMRAEHNAIEGAIDAAIAAPDRDAAVAALRRAIAIVRPHFKKEERVLFAIAAQRLGDDELERLGAAWARARGIG